MNLRVLAEAQAELVEAVDWYAARDEYGELADRFIEEAERAKRLVRERPGAWPEVEPGVRRFVFRRFPFTLIYVVKPDEVLVLAVAHHSRRTSYWRDRH
ncbi:type II toxin-antitoxin system RelE/ParE family toxin [Enhygromyxa salina]|nr:type II toxin-antitoxin system RelE/ParE family toxin [Enhygromyxa salina]